jgi:ABC-type multidrug transport system fused ATPase/permease subunit
MRNLNTQERTSLLAFLSIVLAILSVCAALYQNYIQTKYVDAIQRNVSRAEFNRACRDLIEAYFQVKLRVGLLLSERTGSAGAMPEMFAIEAANAVSRIGAFGTYLANYQNEDVRFRYTQLTRELQRLVLTARQGAERDLEKLFQKADELFTGLNEDCVKTAKAAPL